MLARLRSHRCLSLYSRLRSVTREFETFEEDRRSSSAFLEQLSNNKQIARSVEVDPPGYGSICASSDDCQHPIVHLECTRGSCACLDGYVPLGKYLCYSVDGHGRVMRRSSVIYFSGVLFEGEVLNETATATDSTTLATFKQTASETDKDLGRLGKTCTTDYYCRRIVAQSHCYNGKCACLDGFVASDSLTCVQGKCCSTI